VKNVSTSPTDLRAMVWVNLIVKGSSLCYVRRGLLILPRPLELPVPAPLSASSQNSFKLLLYSCYSDEAKVKVKLDVSSPYAYYQILEIPRSAKQSEVKAAYFRLAKLYHPDVAGDDAMARENFETLTEAYTTLIDLTQRYFYDRHGHSSEELKKKGSHSTIFDWQPKYTIYEDRKYADGESSEVEEWFKAQGHSGMDSRRISIRQRLKNAYVELRFGLDYYNFPWKLKLFFASLIAWIVGLFATRELLIKSMQSFSRRPPVQFNFKWENTDIYDILWYAGARKNSSDTNKDLKFPTNISRKRPKSELEVAGMHHMPKKTEKKSEYSHTIYSNTRSRTLKKNKERHRKFKEERKKEKERVTAWKKECKEREEEFAMRELSKRKRQMREGKIVR